MRSIILFYHSVLFHSISLHKEPVIRTAFPYFHVIMFYSKIGNLVCSQFRCWWIFACKTSTSWLLYLSWPASALICNRKLQIYGAELWPKSFDLNRTRSSQTMLCSTLYINVYTKVALVISMTHFTDTYELLIQILWHFPLILRLNTLRPNGAYMDQ